MRPAARISGLDHVQLSMPPGGEDAARAFYGALLGLTEVPKPPVLAVRGGCWFVGSGVAIHLGVETDFRPARKAHVALVVDDLGGLRAALEAAGANTVDVFDLQATGGGGQRIGHWDFPVSQAAKNWYGSRLVYAYVLRCPWPHGKRPAHSPLTVRITFVDELTRRQFAAQGTVTLPATPTNAATSQP
jgi:catechol 2,3-dioxygenase-like lactoylglutathione lyase family enzyme